jgi:hypothetical protein
MEKNEKSFKTGSDLPGLSDQFNSQRKNFEFRQTLVGFAAVRKGDHYRVPSD